MVLTIEIPDHLSAQIEQYRDHLPELIEQSLSEMDDSGETFDAELSDLITLLASQPTAEEILAIQPSTKMQARMSKLLAQNKSGLLSSAQNAQLERLMLLEHLIRLAKSTALKQQSA